jgi:YVTN family beta-propeller protein
VKNQSLKVALFLGLVVELGLVLPTPAQSSFVNFETPHVHPLDATPDGRLLIAVNTPDNRIEVFKIDENDLVHAFDVPVGLDPVSVRARSDSEVWVVNHLSDSVSVVDLTARAVVDTLPTDDEPCDVVFARGRAFVSCSQTSTVLVFDPEQRSGAPVRIPILGEDPRALAVSPDGGVVYAAIFESGNGSTILGGGLAVSQTLAFPPNVVSDPAGPHGGVNPPPNAGAVFQPPINPNIPAPPRVGLVVKKDAQGRWRDDTGADWTELVSGAQADKSGRLPGWDLPDRDLAMIDSSTLEVGYRRTLMNICMALDVNPRTGMVAVVGTDATNEIRFEPVISGRFLRVNVALVPPRSTDPHEFHTARILDLNPHLDYSVATLPQSSRDLSIGDPRGVAWHPSGTRAYVAGQGSNCVVAIDQAGRRAGLNPTIEVGEGPTGLVCAKRRLYVLNRFEASISVIDLETESEISRASFFDPTPSAIRQGRRHLYDTHETSGLGHIACGSCHVDARFDRLAWDLGDPSGTELPTNLLNRLPLGGGFPPFHPMKGPMATQTLQDIIGHEPHHWRGDRDGLEAFNGAFVGLQADDEMLTPREMQQYEDFLASIHFPPNPYRNLDNSLPADLPLPGHYTPGNFSPAGQPLPNGNAVRGLALYRPPSLLDGGALACATCHTLPTGTGPDFRFQGGQFVPIAPGPNGERHHAVVNQDGSTNRVIKIPQLRNAYDKVGFDLTQLENTSGFGFLHDGSVDSLARFVAEPAFILDNDQDVADLVAFLLAFSGSDLPGGSTGDFLEGPGTASQDTHAAVGVQSTLRNAATAGRGQRALIDQLTDLADLQKIGLVARQRGGRSYAYLGGDLFQSDRAAETVGAAELRASAAPGSELTYTAVPFGSQVRIGIDRDLDGWFDGDERAAGTDPADPGSVPSAGVDSTSPH